MTAPKNKNKPRAVGQCLLLTAGACLFALALLEIALRFLPVQSHIPYEPVNELNPVARYRACRSFVFSHHWNFQNVTYGRTNAQGFVCGIDYDATADSPLIAVVGDSYIEARMITYTETLQARLSAELSGAARMYAFAMNGAALSQYLIFAQHARDTYRPDALIVNIVSNDFDESFTAYHCIARFHYFTEDADGSLRPRLTGAYNPSMWREQITHSALVRYLYFHLRITDVPRRVRHYLRKRTGVSRPGKFHDRTESAKHMPDKRRTLSERAADAFLRLLPEYSGLAPENIVLILDGQRRFVYHGRDSLDARYEHIRRYMLEQARLHGYEVIDMHPVFYDDFTAHGQRFDFAHDAHWNARAHGLAAREAARSRTLSRFFITPRPDGSGPG